MIIFGMVEMQIVTTNNQLDVMLDVLSAVDLFAFDSETVGLEDLSIVGLAFATKDEEWYVPVGHVEGQQLGYVDLENVWYLFGRAEKKIVAHNWQFD